MLQHPKESRQAKGTAPLLRLGLQRCEVRVGEVFEPPPQDRRNLLLYPDSPGSPGEAGVAKPADDAAQLSLPPSLRRPLRLIVLDGTWRQSRRLMEANPWLAALPRLSVPDAGGARYAALRRAHRPGQLSTLEASLLALQTIEGPRFEPLWRAFEDFISMQSALRARP